MPVTDRLQSEMAIGFDEYSTFGAATTWKIGNTYKVTDELKLRGVVATGFRASSGLNQALWMVLVRELIIGRLRLLMPFQELTCNRQLMIVLR
jgi:hypothetical protein